jgi:large subunit ribosomal protein L24
MKASIKSGQEVVVIAGSSKGQRGRVLQVSHTKQRVVVEGLNLQKRHLKARGENQEAGIIDREGSFHISNIMDAARFDSRKNNKAE